MGIEEILGLSIVVCLILSAFFSCSETGLTGASSARLHKLASEGNKKAKLAIELRHKKDELISSILVGNNIVNILSSMLAGVLFGMWFAEGVGIILATAVMTVLILIFGEIMPKTFAFNNSDKVAIRVSPIWFVLIKFFRPLTIFFRATSGFLLKIFGLAKKEELMAAKDALRGAIEMHHKEGNMVKDDRDMLSSIIDLAEVEVGKIMVHRTDMTTLNLNEEPKELIRQAIESKHTRLPIWEGNEENIIGILNAKDVLKLDRENPTTEEIRELLHETHFVPENRSLRDQLKSFRSRRLHMSVVVDEYGALLGLVTLEDILEEIVGQIHDEHDKAMKGINMREDGSIKVKGSLSIRDLNREMGWNLPTHEDASTVAGFVIHIAERIPEVGEKITYQDLVFKIVRRQENQLTRIRITKK